MPDFSHEARLGVRPIAGLDEAGCGAWAGPVVAAAALFVDPPAPSSVLCQVIQDSKTLSPAKREVAFAMFQEHPQEMIWSVGLATLEEIETLNIRKASLLAMSRAVEGLEIQPKAVLVDGLSKPTLVPTCAVHTLVKGDGKSLSIAAASIIAKVTRDRMMDDLHQAFPQFGWDQNRGYGTKAHQDALAQWGVSPHHRRGYAPIAKLLA